MERENKFIKQRNQKLGEKTVAAFQKRHFDAFYCETAQDALNKVLELIKKDDVIAWGGSMTIKEIGLVDYLERNGYKTINRDKAPSAEEKLKCAYDSFFADVFLMSANAISSDGQMVNIDGLGNRVAALSFGPKTVIVIAGVNKVVKTLDEAYKRARNYAAPVNLQRIASMNNNQTPCALTGNCADCISPDSICCQIVTTRLCRPAGRIKIILVNDELGY